MKNISRLALLLTIAFATLFLAFDPKQKREKEEREDTSEWFVQQRLYPYGTFNYEAYNEAITAARSMQNAARTETTPVWQFAGPTNIGGRITDIEMPSNDQQTIYIAAASGGVFKSTDQGNNWAPIFDQNSSLSIGDIAIAPSNSNILFVGTGEPNNGRGSVTYDGQGVFKSTDAGATWTSVGLQNTRTTGRIAIDPTNSNKVFVATMGDLFGTGPNRGLYRTTDGGLTWSQVLYVNDSTGAIDVCINPSNTNIVYATTWTRIRRPTYYNYGGAGGNIYKSTDGGTTWSILTTGLPANNANIGKISIDISASNPSKLYATYSDPVGAFVGMYVTTNGGTSWSTVSGNSFLLSNLAPSSQFFWGGRVKIDPNNSNTLYIGDLSMWKSTDGGGTWNDIGQAYHVDHHATFVHPANSSLVLEGTDGGFFLSTDGGSTWNTAQNLPISQFYHCEVDNSNPSNLYGGMQDNGTAYTPTGNTYDWQPVFGGDGFYAKVDPTNNLYNYYEYQYGNLSVSMNGINQNEPSNWNSPIEMNPLHPGSVYVGRKSVYKSTDHGNNWNAISPDLTAGPQTGNLVFHTLTTISCSRVDTNIIWAGCDDGTVQVSSNNGGSWTNVSAGVPVRWITRVTADPVMAGRAYVTVSGFKWHEYTPHILKTDNYGQTWTDISSNLPQAPVNDIIVDPQNNNILYAATDVGVYFSTNLGGNWQSAGTGLPLVPIMDLVLHNGTRTLVAATYGRSMWTMDLNQLLGTHELSTVNSSVFVFPDPVKDHFTVSLKTNNTAHLDIFSADGKLVMTKELFSENEVVDRNELPAGIYLYVVKMRDGKSSSGKLIFQ